MKNVLFSCAAHGASGYSETSRNYIAAMSQHPVDINLSVKSVTFERWSTDQSAYDSILKPVLNKHITPDVQIIHMTPENFPVHQRAGIKNIGYTVWETTRLPSHWVPLCNRLDEIWTSCDWNVQVFRDSGITVPVHKIEHTIDLSQFDNIVPVDLGIPKDKFIFYSIFQWTERKNPEGLIRAFLSEFGKRDDVALVLKTYRQDNSEKDKKWIEQEVLGIKQSMFVDDHAPVMVIHKMLSRQEILSLHKTGHCLVLPHRAEAWSVSPFEALAVGTPAISTNFGGNTEFMNSDNSYLLDYQLTPVANMPWKIYNGKSMWAEPNIAQLREYMRHVYNNYSEAKAKAEIGRKSLEKFNWNSIGKKIVDQLNK